MPRLLTETEIDPITEEIDNIFSAEEEATASALSQHRMVDNVPDLSDGGIVNGVRLRPMAAGQTLERGRAAARLAWMWNGTETVLPLAWTTDGKTHDGARRYFRKRHCLCCGTSGFVRICPVCSGRNGPPCTQCQGGTDRTEQELPNGDKVKGWVIPCFYPNKERVPCQQKFYGNIDCFLPLCPRRGDRGFRNDEDMRTHARFRHRAEYLSYQEAQNARQKSDVDKLQEQINMLTTALLKQGSEKPARERTPERIQADRDRMARVRAARKQPVKDH